MRSIFLYLSLILLSTVQSSSDPAPNLLGSWSNATINVMLPYASCCIPTSINITKVQGSTNLTATFGFSSNNKYCVLFFNDPQTGTMNLTQVQVDGTYAYDSSPRSDQEPFFRFELYGGGLNVATPNQGKPQEHCDFTLENREVSDSESIPESGSYTSYIKYIGIILVIIFPVCIWRIHRKKKEAEIAKQCLAEETTNYTVSVDYDEMYGDA